MDTWFPLTHCHTYYCRCSLQELDKQRIDLDYLLSARRVLTCWKVSLAVALQASVSLHFFILCVRHLSIYLITLLLNYFVEHIYEIK